MPSSPMPTAPQQQMPSSSFRSPFPFRFGGTNRVPPLPGRDNDRFSVDHQDLVLVEALCPEPEAFLRDHLDDLDARGDLVPEEHGRLEFQGLRQVEAPRPRELHPDRRRDRSRREETVRDPLLEPGLRRELLRSVDWITIPRDPGEQEDILLGEDFRELCGVSHRVHPDLLWRIRNETLTNN